VFIWKIIMAYTIEFREEIIRKVLSVNRTDSILSIANNNGVRTRTIRRWVKKHNKALGENDYLAKNNKVAAVLSTINLSFEERAIFCRKNGILLEELDDWEDELKDILSAGAVSSIEYKKLKKEKDELKKQLKVKEKELERKDKALAEAAALLLLQKKVQNLLEEEDENTKEN
jgi:transposase